MFDIKFTGGKTQIYNKNWDFTGKKMGKTELKIYDQKL